MTEAEAANSPQGRPIWLDLMTRDVEGAKAFYGELFGWRFADQGEDFGHYHLISCGDGLVGGLMTSYMSPDGPTTEPSGPTLWTVYLETGDMDAALAAVPGAGGQVVFGPMDIPGQGRQAMIVDAAGAHVGLWQPQGMDGFATPLTPGTPVWFEQLSTDLDAAIPFYRDVLGWEISWMAGSAEEPGQGFRYATNGEGQHAVAGLCDASQILPPGVPSFWRAYVGVADADATAARIRELGGQVHDQPADSPFGRFAQVADPQGAIFMINEEPKVGGDAS